MWRATRVLGIRKGVTAVADSLQYSLPPREGFVLTHFLTVADVKRSADFYSRVLGGSVVREGEPSIIQLANSWIIVNVGGGPTDDKPTVVLRTPQNPDEVASFLNIRVADIYARVEEWRQRGAEFLTEPKHHATEIRCYMRDPDGHLIEVGQSYT
jgi:catechol 2,3-dioxygenase-like lactoylglutathione lyase family enzyme